MKNKEQQIKEMMIAVPQTIVAYDTNLKGQHLYGIQRLQIVEALYNAGYRKESDIETELQELNIKYYNEAKDLRCKLADTEAKIKRLEKENACLLQACEKQFTFSTTANKTYSIFNSVRKEFAEKLKAKARSVVGFNVRERVYAKEYSINEIEINEILKEYEK